MISTNVNIEENINAVFEMQQQYAKDIRHTTAKERLAYITQVEAYLRDEKNVKALTEAMRKDLRKPPVEVYATEIGPVLANIQHIKKSLKKWMRDKKVSTPIAMAGTSSYIHYEPKGVTLVIAPWNYPFMLTVIPTLYSVAAGNTVMVKPSEVSGHTAGFIHQMLDKIFDKKHVAVFEGDVPVATALLAMPFNHIHFTGSPAIGKVVMKAASQHLTSVTLELGGKSPAIVDKTAHISSTAEKLTWAKSLNNGQTCIAPDYVLVHESVKDQLVEAVGKNVNKFFNKGNQGVQQSPDYGRIINERHYQRINGLIEDAINQGANIAVGGEMDAADKFISPTLLVDVNDGMEIMHEEIFGPVLPIVSFKNKEEVIDIIGKHPKPLALYIASKSSSNIDYFINNTSSGGTVINDFMLGTSNPNLPFGGVNNSGIGKSLGHHSFIDFSNERGIIKRKWASLKIIFPPYNDSIMTMVKQLYKWT